MGKSEKRLDLDAAISPGAMPALGVSDILRWMPVVEELIAGVKAAIAQGSFEIPAIHLRIFGKHLKLGPVPVALES